MQSGLAMRRTVGAVCSHFLFTYFQEQIGLMYTVWFGCNYPCLYWYSLCYPFLYLSIFFNSLGIASSPKVNQAIYVYQNIRQKASLQIFSEVKCSCQLSRKQTQKKIITVGKTENQKSFDNDMPLCWSCKQKQDLLRVQVYQMEHRFMSCSLLFRMGFCILHLFIRNWKSGCPFLLSYCLIECDM